MGERDGFTRDDAEGTQDDGALLRLARGDPAAFACFYRRHVRAIHAKLRRAVGDEQVALDLTAEVFARALARVHGFRGARPESGVAWINAIADRLLLDHHRARGAADRALRRLAIEPPVLGDDDGEGAGPVTGHALPLSAALASLPERQRDVIRLRLVDELSYAEISARFGISQAATRQHLSRGLRALNERLTEGGS
jgi:RNA polymerase sigma-70 factor (ECF subfamily)